jgi:TolB-like protein/Tfp pilus assembly protein PilF/predicted Ser/Thr protein kinase
MDGEALPAAAMPGTTLGSYRIERVLGRGGMGTVFLAYDTKLHRQVALKLVDAPADGESSRTRLLREARNAAALNHPNICTIYEVGEAGGAAFIAMEYVDGESLSDRIDRGPLAPHEAIHYALQAAEALACAHEHGVIHRDFKAGNAIVTTDDRLKIVDFGLARRGDERMAAVTTMASIVPAGTVAGTPYAMAPEQVRGDSSDPRSDVWALGVLLYEMLSGAPPFRAATFPELMASILRDAPAPLPAGVALELQTVIEQCLARAPEQRYQRAAEVRAALAAIQAGTPTPRLARTVRAIGGRRTAAASAVTLLAIASILVALNVGGLRERVTGRGGAAPVKLLVLPFQNLTGDPDQEYFSDGLTDEIITQIGRLDPQRLSVIARTSSMRYKNRDVPVEQIGRELGVAYVLEGSARREGSRVRVNATLIDVQDQTQRWSDSLDRELASMIGLQSDIARGVANALSLALAPAEQARLSNVRRVDPEAYEAYLRGVSHRSKLTRPDLDTAEKYFELALSKDPGYALAYEGLASVWSARQQMQFVRPVDAAPRIRAAAAKALELDSTLAEVHYQLAAQYAWTDWDWVRAGEAFRRAIDMRPNYAEARAFYGHYLFIVGRPAEGLQQIQRALELDPLSDLIRSLYGVLLAFARQTDEAITQFQTALKTSPRSPVALNGLARTLHDAQRQPEALEAERAAWAALDDRQMLAAFAEGAERGGYRGALRHAADTFAARSLAQNTAPLAIAVLYLRAGDKERALEWLERSFTARDPNVPYAGIGPEWDLVRDDPRMRAVLQRMNLPR